MLASMRTPRLAIGRRTRRASTDGSPINWAPNPRDPATFDYLLDSDFGSIDIVPLISGTYEQLAPRAASVRRGEHSVLVEAVSDLLTTLTVPRREKDADQVRELRRIQTSFTHSDAACSPERDDGL